VKFIGQDDGPILFNAGFALVNFAGVIDAALFRPLDLVLLWEVFGLVERGRNFPISALGSHLPLRHGSGHNPLVDLWVSVNVLRLQGPAVYPGLLAGQFEVSIGRVFPKLAGVFNGIGG